MAREREWDKCCVCNGTGRVEEWSEEYQRYIMVTCTASDCHGNGGCWRYKDTGRKVDDD